MKKQDTPPGYRRIVLKNKKRGGKKRVVYAPGESVKEYHKEFIKKFGRVRYPSISQCIGPHIASGNLYWLKMDLKDAFGSVTEAVVRKYIKRRCLEFPGGEEIYFHQQSRGLIQGSPVSPLIFEVFCLETIDGKLGKYCRERGLIYTRYRDDLIFSSSRLIPKGLRKKLGKIIRSYSLRLNEGKTEVVYLQNKPMEALGIVAYQGDVFGKYEIKSRLADLESDDPEFLTEERRNQIQGIRAWLKYIQKINNWGGWAIALSSFSFIIFVCLPRERQMASEEGV